MVMLVTLDNNRPPNLQIATAMVPRAFVATLACRRSLGPGGGFRKSGVPLEGDPGVI